MSVSDGPLFITTDAVGGVWRYSVALARGLAAEGRRCKLAVLGPAPNDAQRAEIAKLPYCELLETGLPLDWMLAGTAEIDRLAQDVANVARAVGTISAHLHAPALASQGWTMPVVAVAHSCMATWWDAVRGGERPDNIAWHGEATARGLEKATVVVAPSHAFARALTLAYRVDRPVRVIHNGLPPAASCGGPRSAFVLAAGRLWDDAKNLDTLDQAAALMQAPVCMAGPLSVPDGSSATFRRLAHLGNLPAIRLAEIMSEAAIFASPALYEPFGLAVLEAAQQATPLVLADIPTFRELWSDAALFVSARDPRAWANCLDSLMGDANRRHALGRAAQTRARRYSQRAMVAATAAIHRGIGPRTQRAA